MNLEDRIQKSREAIARYPSWVKASMVFQGGGPTRTECHYSSKSGDALFINREQAGRVNK